MKRVLVAPLDWGLGHATRCVPIIRYLLERRVEVLIASGGRAFHFLKQEFPNSEFIEIPGYNILYASNGFMFLKMALQIPTIVMGIRREHKLLQQIIKEKKIDAVISDNRYGLWDRRLPCVFITHQIRIKSPMGEKYLYRLNKKYISRFTECWVPDYDRPDKKLSGALSDESLLPANAKYIGWLSRFSSSVKKSNAHKRKLLVILSGPEPQRTVLEKIILEQLREWKTTDAPTVLIVQGKTETTIKQAISDKVEMVSQLSTPEMEEAILSSEIVLSRSGYSTIMDMVVLGKQCVFVPTPGQTEQEYLAFSLSQKKIAYAQSQTKFDLQTALQQIKAYKGFEGGYSSEEYKTAIDDLLGKL